MQDDAAPYLDRCREMGFDELVEFIADSLKRRFDPDPGGDRPHSREEFRGLEELLREKYKAMPSDPPLPPPPTDPLEDARKKRARTMDRLYDSYDDPKAKKKHRAKMVETIDRLDKAIKDMQAGNLHRYYRPPAPVPDTPKRDAYHAMHEIIGDIERAFKAQPTGVYHWRALPPGEATPAAKATRADVNRYYHDRLQSEGKFDRFNQDRLDKATELPYVEWWVPSEKFGGFDGYSIISFALTDKVLLECPIYGNAAYVIGAGEESWKDTPKHQLVESGLAEKISHQGENWHERIQQALDLELTANGWVRAQHPRAG